MTEISQVHTKVADTVRNDFNNSIYDIIELTVIGCMGCANLVVNNSRQISCSIDSPAMRGNITCPDMLLPYSDQYVPNVDDDGNLSYVMPFALYDAFLDGNNVGPVF
ncbi:MAG: hypothetical protein WCO06_05920 [Candidatus Roizmanbacteria bacterium]